MAKGSGGVVGGPGEACPAEACRGCGEGIRIPTPAARKRFEGRGSRCLPCSQTPEALDEVLTAMLAATDWGKLSLGTKLAIAREVARD